MKNVTETLVARRKNKLMAYIEINLMKADLTEGRRKNLETLLNQYVDARILEAAGGPANGW